MVAARHRTNVGLRDQADVSSHSLSAWVDISSAQDDKSPDRSAKHRHHHQALAEVAVTVGHDHRSEDKPGGRQDDRQRKRKVGGAALEDESTLRPHPSPPAPRSGLSWLGQR